MTEGKKKLLRIEDRKIRSKYGSCIGGLSFCWVSSPAQGRVQASSVHTCREAICGAVFRYIMKTTRSDSCHVYGTDSPIDTTCLRLLVLSNCDEKKRLFNAKAMINIIESHLGWKKSTISTVVHRSFDHTWLFTGPGAWMSQPQFVSTYMLLIRWFMKNPIEASTMEELDIAVRARLEKYNTRNDLDLNKYMPALWPNLLTLLMRRDEIFGTSDPEVVYKADGEPVSFYSGSGVYEFVNKRAKYNDHIKAAVDRFSAIRENGA